MAEKQNIRSLALSLLCRMEAAGQYANIALDTAVHRADVQDSDRALLTVLLYGVTERKITLDYIIDSLSSVPPSKIERTTRNILRMGLYQLIFLDRVPSHAAVSESVNLASKRSKGFVNALLREFLRKDKKFDLPDREKDNLLYLSVKYSVPAELCGLFSDIFGTERTESLFAAMNKNPPLTLRTNTEKITRDKLLSLLKEAGIRATATSYSSFGINLAENIPYSSVPGAKEGLWHVQDEASQICTEICGVKPGDTVIDACSCPGGKSFSLAELMNNKGHIYSFDLHENKLSLVRCGAERLGINIIETAEKDGRIFDMSLSERADAVLCDVPCSGLGVLAKKPEIRYKPIETTLRLPEIQYEIAENCLRYVKSGGVLIYSTCTLLPRENEEVVRRLLSAHPELETTDFELSSLRSKDGMLTLYPDVHGFDGFFIAKLRKK